ncbi:TPA: hypothetical protein ACGUVZ_001658 [Vibrio vulnificus]
MDSRVHGNDDGWRGGGVLSFYGIVVLLVFTVIICSSNFSLITSVCQPLSVSQFVILERWGSIVQRVLLLGITASLPVLWGCSMLLSVGASVFPNAASGVCG